MGTDAGNIGTLHGPSVFRENDTHARCRLDTAADSAQRDGRTGARAMGRSDSWCNPRPAKLADVVLLDADPLIDVAKF